MRLIECVANISEGRNRQLIESLSSTISEGGAQVLHVDSGASANRTVYTFVGSPEDVINSAFMLVHKASRHIDMQRHSGEHPCIGAIDVLPFIPLCSVSLDECQKFSETTAQRLWQELKIPCYLYANSARPGKPRRLNQLRAGGFKALGTQVKLPELSPDIGAGFHPSAGISIVGARNLMLAFNVNLKSCSLNLGKRIAKRLRQIRESKMTSNGRSLESVMFMAWHLPDRNLTQISTNIYDFREAPIEFVYSLVEQVASEIGIQVSGSEVIGMLPLAALISNEQGSDSELLELLQGKVKQLNLEELEPFNISQRVLEVAIKNRFKFDIPRL